jgi:hypothetical protein
MMSAETSNWIPRKRIRIAIGLALLLAVAGMVGSLWSSAALVLLLPALGAGWAAFVMLRIRWQLSPGGGGWERRIHELVVSRLALPSDSRASVLDIGCGDASLLIALLQHAPATASISGGRTGTTRNRGARRDWRISVFARPFIGWMPRASSSPTRASMSSSR